MTKLTKSRVISFFVSGLLLLFPATLLAQKADFTADKTTVCSGSTVTFTDTSISIALTSNYKWIFGAGSNPSTANGKGPHTVTYSGTGASTVELIIETLTGSDTEIKKDYITRAPNATISLTSNNNTQTVCSSPIANITYTIGGSGTGATVTGLPNGIKTIFSGTTFTIYGTPIAIEGEYNYTVTTTGPCTNPTVSGTITISSNADDCKDPAAIELEIPTLITPNGDGINDYFEIRGLQKPLGKIELIIFDRRGLQVYRDANYQKDSKYENRWNGVDQSGNPLPEDTYYYSIKNVQKEPLSGYIVIRR